MSIIRKFLARVFPPIQPLPAGLYHCQMPAVSTLPYRLHLRLEPDGQGLLVVNASTIVHLNQTAAEYAYHLVRGTPEDQAVAELSRRYNVKREIILRDYHDLINRLRELILTPDLDPESFLNFQRQSPYTGSGSAPYRLDCALTYHLPDEGAGNLAPLDRVSRELLSEEWEKILEKAWRAGIPHVVFTGGEPTLRPDLGQIIAFAEKLGMVSGLITNGMRLSESKYLHELLQSGLDHVMILLDPLEDQTWEAIRDVMVEDISLTVHLTLNRHNHQHAAELLDRLAEMRVKNLSLSMDSPDLEEEMVELQRRAAEKHLMHLVWDLPVPYSQSHPVALELSQDAAAAGLSGSGQGWVYVEPDGDVLPGQGQYHTVLGNLLLDEWENIWQTARIAA